MCCTGVTGQLVGWDGGRTKCRTRFFQPTLDETAPTSVQRQPQWLLKDD